MDRCQFAAQRGSQLRCRDAGLGADNDLKEGCGDLLGMRDVDAGLRLRIEQVADSVADDADDLPRRLFAGDGQLDLLPDGVLPGPIFGGSGLRGGLRARPDR
jgi:hypothetical protein